MRAQRDSLITSALPHHGRRRLERAVREHLARSRFTALAAAVRRHEERTARHVGGGRPHDAALYERLRRILGARESTSEEGQAP